jgi:hypothetical protein
MSQISCVVTEAPSDFCAAISAVKRQARETTGSNTFLSWHISWQTDAFVRYLYLLIQSFYFRMT